MSDLLALKAGRGETETEVRRVLGAKMVTQGGEARWGGPETRVRAAYKAEADAMGTASFLVTARLVGQDQVVPRLGLRGTGQIVGEEVSLFFYLFRRPLTTLRQTLGW